MITRVRSYLLVFATIVPVGVLAFFVETQNVFAQGSGYYNFGSSPSLSPWLGLTNRPTGSLDPYNQYVRPRLEIERAFQSQQSQISRQGIVQQDMMRRQNLGVQPGAGIGTQTGAPTVGRFKPAATFRNYSHYYPNMRGR